jgi:hypothetical protein
MQVTTVFQGQILSKNRFPQNLIDLKPYFKTAIKFSACAITFNVLKARRFQREDAKIDLKPHSASPLLCAIAFEYVFKAIHAEPLEPGYLPSNQSPARKTL